MSENRQLSVMDIASPITYDSAFGSVTLSKDVVLKYLKRGSSELTDQEVALFINLCMYQKLNPFIGEAYAIKFGSDFQMIVGYDTYKRRAEENPEYRGREDGIVVLRNNDISHREGACLYPGDTLIGGWCRVHRERNGHVEASYTEVSLSEYQKTKDGKPTSNWASKPATMIRKVAVSQALRDAFPKQYEGLHTEYEMPNGQEDSGSNAAPSVIDGAEKISQDERRALFNKAKELFGERGGEILKQLMDGMGYQSTQNLDKRAYRELLERLEDTHRAESVDDADDDNPFPPEG